MKNLINDLDQNAILLAERDARIQELQLKLNQNNESSDRLKDLERECAELKAS